MRLPKMTRHKRGQGVVRIRGRDYYCGKFGSDEANHEYERLIKTYLENKTAFGPPTQSITLTDLVLKFVEHSKEIQGKSEWNNIRLFGQYVIDTHGDVLASEVRPSHFKEIRTAISQVKSRSRQYVNKLMKIFTRMLKWAISEELLSDTAILDRLRCIEPLKLGRCKLAESAPVAPVDPSVINATIKHLPPVVADMVRVQELLGCRPGELCAIKPNMIDKTKSVWVIELAKHKTAHLGHSRALYVGPKAQAILAKYLDRDPESYCFCPTEAVEQRRAAAAANRKTPANQGNRRGYGRATRTNRDSKQSFNDCYNTISYGHAIRFACRKAFPPPPDLNAEQVKTWNSENAWAPNQLRHNAGTDILEQFSLEHVAANHGHSNVNTSKTYAKIKKERAIEVAKTR